MKMIWGGAAFTPLSYIFNAVLLDNYTYVPSSCPHMIDNILCGAAFTPLSYIFNAVLLDNYHVDAGSPSVIVFVVVGG